MRTKTVSIFTFDELSDEAKEKARDGYREHALDYEWWDYTYEDAKNIGLEIQEFDLDRGGYIKARFMVSAEVTAYKIETEHGESCETFQDAKNYLKDLNMIMASAPRTSDGELEDEYRLEGEINDLDVEFLKTLQEDYRIILQEEMEYLLSAESVDDGIRANEYEFTADGKVA